VSASAATLPSSYPAPPEPLPSGVTVADSHCHLDIVMDPERDGAGLSVDAALAAAREVGVTKVVQVGCDVDGARWAVDVANRFDDVVAAVALHPNEAPRMASRGALDDGWSVVESLAADGRVRAVGETGLDHFRTPPEGRAVQEESFRRHIDLAKRLGKALVIHDRDAHDDVLRVLDDEGAPEHVVFHCFSGDAAMARRCVASGWVLSFAGTVTFRNAQGLRDALAVTPVDHLLVETDAPYLAPVPFRGRPNASYLVPVTLRAMAEVKGLPVEELAEAVARTTTATFGSW
jgi:TatD DNase family protein